MITGSTRQLRLAFDYSVSESKWTGGISYFSNLFSAIRTAGDYNQTHLSLLTSEKPNSKIDQFVDQIILLPKAERPRLSKIIYTQLLRELHLSKNIPNRTQELLMQNNIHAIFSTGHYGPAFQVPLAAWIPDFQHLYLPDMFTREEVDFRSKLHKGISIYADIVILSSEAARKDFEQFVPSAADKARVIRFAAAIPEDVYLQDATNTCNLYHLPEKFIYLPNQFWKHKNHSVVIDSLSLLHHKHKELTVVCTGNTNDYRDMDYFGGLLKDISSKGIRDNLIILGVIPKSHVFQIMRRSIAVLQPSRFEGWSTTIEEGKSLGKQFILSDIPVHHEQCPSCAVFFNPNSPEELSEILVNVFESYKIGPDLDKESIGRQELPNRIKNFGKTFLSVMNEISQ